MKNKINILFVLPNFDTGGSEKLVFDIIKHIDKSKFNPVLCVFFSGVYEKEFLSMGLPFYVVHDKEKKRSKWRVVKFLSDIIRKHKIDIINAHHMTSLLQGLPSFKIFNKVYVIYTEHTRMDCYEHIKKYHLALLRMYLKFTNMFLGISQGVCDYFHHEMKVPARKIVKILNGVDIERFQFDKEKGKSLKEKYRKDLNLSGDDIVIGLFANFRKQKNHECLIKAAKILKDKGVDKIKIVLAGNGPEFENIKKLSETLDLKSEILFLGPRLDIPELMNMIDIYCLPSFFEGLPFSLMEAIVAGKPCVATNVEGNDEVLEDEATGVLVEKNNPQKLADALMEVTQDKNLREKMSENSLEASNNFSFQSMMKNYENLFLTIMNEER